jgi:hypothetical protein
MSHIFWLILSFLLIKNLSRSRGASVCELMPAFFDEQCGFLFKELITKGEDAPFELEDSRVPPAQIPQILATEAYPLIQVK